MLRMVCTIKAMNTTFRGQFRSPSSVRTSASWMRPFFPYPVPRLLIASMADLFEGVVGVHADAEAHAQHALLARRSDFARGVTARSVRLPGWGCEAHPGARASCGGSARPATARLNVRLIAAA